MKIIIYKLIAAMQFFVLLPKLIKSDTALPDFDYAIITQLTEAHHSNDTPDSIHCRFNKNALQIKALFSEWVNGTPKPSIDEFNSFVIDMLRLCAYKAEFRPISYHKAIKK